MTNIISYLDKIPLNTWMGKQDLSGRAHKGLSTLKDVQDNPVTTLGQLVRLQEYQLMLLTKVNGNFGKGTLWEVKEALAADGLHLGLNIHYPHMGANLYEKYIGPIQSIENATYPAPLSEARREEATRIIKSAVDDLRDFKLFHGPDIFHPDEAAHEPEMLMPGAVFRFASSHDSINTLIATLKHVFADVAPMQAHDPAYLNAIQILPRERGFARVYLSDTALEALSKDPAALEERVEASLKAGKSAGR